MGLGQNRRRLVRIVSAFILIAGCMPISDHSRQHPIAVKNLTTKRAPTSNPWTQRYAKNIAAKVAATAHHTEKEEGRQDLVKDDVVMRLDAHGRPIVEQLGEASWYGTWHHGRMTASGTRFDEHEFTAAHPTLPLGTVATVTSLATGRSVEVVINDRGPYVRGRDIDLSWAAAQEIGVIRQGAAAVRIDAFDLGPARAITRLPSAPAVNSNASLHQPYPSVRSRVRPG